MNKAKFTIIILVILLLAALLGNPSHAKHKEKIWQKYRQQNPITGTLLGFADVKDEILAVVAYEDYYLFSITYVSLNSDYKISFGAMGVVVVGNLDLKQFYDTK